MSIENSLYRQSLGIISMSLSGKAFAVEAVCADGRRVSIFASLISLGPKKCGDELAMQVSAGIALSVVLGRLPQRRAECTVV